MRSVQESEVGLKRLITIDIGCGPRNNLSFYGFEGQPTMALDLSKPFLEGRRASNGRQTGNLVQADAARLPIQSGIADHVFATHVLEHVDRLPETLDEIGRIVKPGGKVTMAVPDPRYERLMRGLEKEYCSPKMHQRVISPDDLRRGLERRGLVIVKNQKRGFLMAIYNTLSYLIHRKLLKDRQMETQSGRLISCDGTISENGLAKDSKIKQMIKKIIYSGPFPFLFACFTKIYPYENYLVAIKPEGVKTNEETIDN